MKKLATYKNCFIINKDSKKYLINMKNRRLWVFDEKKYPIGNKDYSLAEDLIERLIYEGIIDENLEDTRTSTNDLMYQPILGTFLMTTICNLKCQYCYAYNNENILLEITKSKAAVDYLIKNAQIKASKKIILKFHGVGEPTLNWKALVDTYNYARLETKKLGLELRTGITTNGVCTDEQRIWISENMDEVTISIDGFKDVQTVQRPHGYLDSFDEVIKTIDAINKSKITIRTTVTNLNVISILEWTKYLDRIGVKRVNFEPVIICGRGKEENINDVSNEEFVSGYLKAKEYAKNSNIDVSYSGIKLDKNTIYHCGAYGRNFVVTPNGLVSTCYEVVNRSNNNLDKFIIGDCNGSKVEIEFQRVKDLRVFSKDKRRECRGCFAEFNCSGGCISKRAIDDQIIEKSTRIKCCITKDILYNELINSIECDEYEINKIYTLGKKG